MSSLKVVNLTFLSVSSTPTTGNPRLLSSIGTSYVSNSSRSSSSSSASIAIFLYLSTKLSIQSLLPCLPARTPPKHEAPSNQRLEPAAAHLSTETLDSPITSALLDRRSFPSQTNQKKNKIHT
ncbi:unnamed protein product [Cuscuta epithymum]|uniref:Uncharacterized protein n=1 Tax=Cuscuta epithymum TaxID=186058 RepID=A0AAV0FJF2_9ASTE|nr:unnamed protein product [Cuscuta epithymum]